MEYLNFSLFSILQSYAWQHSKNQQALWYFWDIVQKVIFNHLDILYQKRMVLLARKVLF